MDNTPLAGIFGTFAQTNGAQDASAQTGAAVTELQPNASPQTLAELNSDIAQELATLRPDMALFQDWAGENGELFQEMDWGNMMSWALSPNNARVEHPFQ